jgi:hypothetical protein
MYFGMKNTFKKNYYHTPKYSLGAFIEAETRFEIYIKKEHKLYNTSLIFELKWLFNKILIKN